MTEQQGFMASELKDFKLRELTDNLSADALLRMHEVEKLRWKKFEALSGGFVCLVDVMGDDAAIVQAARVSYGAGTKKVSDDQTLIRYLMRHRHTTPFEMAEIKLLVKCPMDLWRQWIRHRTANVNEYSTRYSVAIDEADETDPRRWRLQSGKNKQGSEGVVMEWPEGYTVEEQTDGYLVKHPDRDDFFCHDATTPGAYLSAREQAAQNMMRSIYEERVDNFDVAREQARKDLPLSTYTQAYWKIDLHNLFHFLGLRMHSHAQEEIRTYAHLIGHEIVKPLFPAAWEAFEQYRLNAAFVSGPAIQVMQTLQKQFGCDEITLSSNSVNTSGGLKFTHEAFESAVESVFPDWMHTDGEGNLKRHREREEVRSTLIQLGVLSAA